MALNPMPDLSRLYWSWHAKRYDRITLLLNRRFPDMVARVAETVRGKNDVLEIAAGTGLLTKALARAAGNLVATDRSPEMLWVLRARLQRAGLSDRVQVREADAVALDFPDASFDVVVMANLLHLLPSPARALEAAHRVLRPGGLLCAPTFCHGENGVSRGVSRALSLSGFPIMTRFTGASLRELVQQSGFALASDETFAGVLPIHLVVAHAELS